jgi:hypothetical protein
MNRAHKETSEMSDSLLDSLRDHPEWSDAKRAEVFDRLIAEHSQAELMELIQGRLGNLHGHDGEAVLRLVEALATKELLDKLAKALKRQPDLPAERAWEALELLQENELLDAHPDLAERWDELNEAIDENGSLDQLVEQLEGDSEGIWLALQGMAAVEPEVRAQIVADLRLRPLTPGLIEFLRLLSFSPDLATRDAALEALAGRAVDEQLLVAAWAKIAADHFDTEVAARALRWLGDGAEPALSVWAAPDRPVPKLVRSWVTSLDGQGQGYVLLAAEDRGRWAAAAYSCDVMRGIREVIGLESDDPQVTCGLFAEVARCINVDSIEDAPELAFGLLAGSLLLCGPETTPVLRYWLEHTVGPTIRPRSFMEQLDDWDPSTLSREELIRCARAVLTACPSWGDESNLTYELAEEIVLREGKHEPDPVRDAGIHRYLFEHRLQGHIELYRRMLFWMAAFWNAAGDCDLGSSALAIAWHLSEVQNVVPSHPFLVALASQSLSVAMINLKQGIDLRNPELRARRARGVRQ